MITDTGLKVRKIKFNKKCRIMKRIPQNRGDCKEGSTTANDPVVNAMQNSCADTVPSCYENDLKVVVRDWSAPSSTCCCGTY